MKVFNIINSIARDDLVETIKPHSKVSIAAACFSIYAYEELKKQLSSVEELRFIFTSPTFITENGTKEKREFYIPRLNRERSLYGTEFEVRLRNELTQKAIAKECAEWIKKKGFVEQIALEEEVIQADNLTLEERLKRQERINALEKEIAALERKVRKEAQPKTKFDLYLQLQNKRGELEALKNG